jgi:hypothetical protein
MRLQSKGGVIITRIKSYMVQINVRAHLYAIKHKLIKVSSEKVNRPFKTTKIM